jgi:signal transduction histidine kinase
MPGPPNDTPPLSSFALAALRLTHPAPDQPGTAISGASVRLRALAALSGSLTDALGPQDAADLVEQQALFALGATSAVVVTLGTFPPPLATAVVPGAPGETALHVVHAIGLPLEIRAALDALPLDAPVPFAEVARTGAPLFLPDEDALRLYPDWGAAMIGAGARAAAVVPVWANGELRGVLGLSWAAPRPFDEDERAFVLTLGTMCAQAIMRAHLRDAERLAREAERQAREAAEHANRSKAHFVATISHELRTPMNAILGYTTLMGEGSYGPVNADQQDHLGRVRSSGQHLLGLIEELLSYARVEAGEAVVRPEPVALLDVVEQSLVLVRPIAAQKGLRVRVEGPAEPVELVTDPHKLRQILVNLLANAVKFTARGEVVVLLRVEGRDAAVRVVIEVTDTGRGIAPEEQAHVFDPFWQADPTSTQSGGSSGLGLSVARQLARLLGGDVTVAQSAPGQGSTFVVSLPAQYPGRPERRAAH